jgi:hypothetical protein
MAVRRRAVSDSAQCFICSEITILYKALCFVAVELQTVASKARTVTPKNSISSVLICETHSFVHSPHL